MGLQHVGTKLCLANDALWHEKAMPVELSQANALAGSPLCEL
jgi:hypothetical protein